MRFNIRKRRALILSMAAVQAVCLFAGTIALNVWLHGAMRQTVHDQAIADSVHTAQQMTTLIRELEVNDLREDETSWGRLQNVVHEIRLPNEGFVCVTDARSGALLCHPNLGSVPTADGGALAGTLDSTLPETPTSKPAKPVAVKPSPADGTPAGRPAVTAGVRDYGGEVQIIAAAYVPELDAHVNVHQKAAGIEESIAAVLRPVVPIGISISVILIVCTSALAVFVLRQYENRVTAINENLEHLVGERTKSLRKVRDAVIFGLAKLAESRDTDTGEHLDRIRSYVSILARQLGRKRGHVNSNYVENLALASSLHDIGKVGIPDAVLLKPGRFNEEERAVMETHASLGGECLEAIGNQLGKDDFLQLAREIAYCHHEKWDGTGYPFRVSGEAIPMSARIVALADVYDALRSRRPYKEPMSHEKARDIIVSSSGKQFDPAVVDAFLESEDLFVDISLRYNDAPEVDTEAVRRELVPA